MRVKKVVFKCENDGDYSFGVGYFQEFYTGLQSRIKGTWENQISRTMKLHKGDEITITVKKGAK